MTMRHPVSKEMDHVPEGNGQGSPLLMYVMLTTPPYKNIQVHVQNNKVLISLKIKKKLQSTHKS